MTTIEPTTGPAAIELPALAARINDEHHLCESALRSGLEHAINAGRLLADAKALCDHGKWGAWLADNFAGSERTAQLYMRVAKNLPALEAKAQRVALLNLREAVALLAEPTPEPSGDPILDKMEAAKGLFTRIRDGLASMPDEKLTPDDMPLKDYERAVALTREAGEMQQAETPQDGPDAVRTLAKRGHVGQAVAELASEVSLMAECKLGQCLNAAELPPFIPPPGHFTYINPHGTEWAMVVPSINAGFYFVAACLADLTGVAGSIEGTKRAVRAERVARFIPDRLKRCPVETWEGYGIGFDVDTAADGKPWEYNRLLYTSHDEYMQREILGKEYEYET